MESNSANPVAGILGFWMFMQLATILAMLLGGVYVLYCLGRAASGLDRLASAVEELVRHQKADTRPLPPGGLPSMGARPAGAPGTGSPPLPQPFVPSAPPVPAPPGIAPASASAPHVSPAAAAVGPATLASPPTTSAPATTEPGATVETDILQTGNADERLS